MVLNEGQIVKVSRRTVLAALAAAPLAAKADEAYILLGSTTTTDNSGFLAHILPLFEAETGIKVRVVVAGTGKILRLIERGDVDVSLTHFPEGERRLVAGGRADARIPVMSNDFIIVGPAADPAGVRAATTAAGAFAAIAAAKALFYSRGDESGTHEKERMLWPSAPGTGAAAPDWYRETGAGMGATLNIAAASDGYTLTDRGTWAAFANRGNLVALFQGDSTLANPYAALLPSAALNPHAKRGAATRFVSWLGSPAGKAAINGFRIGEEQVFFASE